MLVFFQRNIFIDNKLRDRACLLDTIVDEASSRRSLKSMREEVNPQLAQTFKSRMMTEEVVTVRDSVEFVRKGEAGDWKN